MQQAKRMWGSAFALTKRPHSIWKGWPHLRPKGIIGASDNFSKQAGRPRVPLAWGCDHEWVKHILGWGCRIMQRKCQTAQESLKKKKKKEKKKPADLKTAWTLKCSHPSMYRSINTEQESLLVGGIWAKFLYKYWLISKPCWKGQEQPLARFKI